jgi:hypothetical protein
MRTSAELYNWSAEAEFEFGDPAKVVGLLFARYKALAPSNLRLDDDVIATFMSDAIDLHLADLAPFTLSVSPDGPLLHEDGSLAAFAVDRVAPGLWVLEPSLNIPGEFHVFVVLHDVPEPAPWEQQRAIVISR